MCRLQCLFAVFALSFGFVNSWDIAITTADQVEFYSNDGKILNNKDIKSSGLTALAYDAVYNMLLYVDKQSDNASIFSYNLNTQTNRALVSKSFEDIHGLAFDPLSGKLFWTDKTERGIFWKSLRPGSEDNVTQLFKFESHEIPRGIAVDSCRGYIYWTNINLSKATIERARIDGTEKEVIVRDVYMPMGITIDQHEKKIYWADKKEGIDFSIESADLDGKNQQMVATGSQHLPIAIAVSNDSLYWIDSDHRSAWKLPKSARNNKVEPQKLIQFTEIPFGIVANYKIADMTRGVDECATLRELSLNHTAIKDSIDIPNEGVYCLHGEKVGKQECACTKGYVGKRCEISVCQNFCLNGECSVTNDGQPQCRCNLGYTGIRCETDVCHSYCLNEGLCSVDSQRPVCTCSKEFTGERCQTKIAPIVGGARAEQSCNCTTKNDSPAVASESLSANDGDFVEACNDGWDSIRDPVIMILGVVSGLLCVACAVLVTKVMQLKKRPRIKKRIIVQKNATPLTARPDQCEITIENCCNMNICETPCFEPRSTIRPNLLDAKPGKEEKKNLISNMELPDDY